MIDWELIQVGSEVIGGKQIGWELGGQKMVRAEFDLVGIDLGSN